MAVPNATALAARIKEAYRFDAKMQGFDFDSAAFKKSYTVGLASMRLAKKFGYGSGGGAALDSDTYVCHIFLYPYKEVGQTTWDGITASTTAHELEHSLMMRANSYDLPVYINEGIACSLGDRYANLTHEGDSFLKDMAKLLAKCTKADAEHVVRHFRVDKDFDNFKEGNKLYQAEQLGGMFIEFLAARVVKSAPKFFLKWGKVASSLGAHQYEAPNNRSFRQAFKKEFGFEAWPRRSQVFEAYRNDGRECARAIEGHRLRTIRRRWARQNVAVDRAMPRPKNVDRLELPTPSFHLS